MTGDSLYWAWMRRLQLFLAAPASAQPRASGRNSLNMASAKAIGATISAALARSADRLRSSSAAGSC